EGRALYCSSRQVTRTATWANTLLPGAPAFLQSTYCILEMGGVYCAQTVDLGSSIGQSAGLQNRWLCVRVAPQVPYRRSSTSRARVSYARPCWCKSGRRYHAVVAQLARAGLS